LKVGVIGAGAWGKNLVRTLDELGALGAVADVSEVHLEAVRARSPQTPVFTEADALIGSDLPAVAIATPAATHFAIARDSLLAGKHVFVEKPMALTGDEARELVRLADEADRVLMVGHLLLYQPAVQWIKAQIDGGLIGRLRSLHQERLNLGRARSVENVLWSLGVHDVAVMLYLVGESPTGAVADGDRFLNRGIEDDVRLHLEFPGGKKGHLHCSWLWPERRRRLTVIGDAAMLVYDELDQTVTLHRKRIDADLRNVDEGAEMVFEGAGEPLRLEMEHFLECAVSGRQPISSGRSAIPVVDVLEGALTQA
jgi:predicted dehydrogenase